jgi:hypothetical protein
MACSLLTAVGVLEQDGLQPTILSMLPWVWGLSVPKAAHTRRVVVPYHGTHVRTVPCCTCVRTMVVRTTGTYVLIMLGHNLRTYQMVRYHGTYSSVRSSPRIRMHVLHTLPLSTGDSTGCLYPPKTHSGQHSSVCAYLASYGNSYYHGSMCA